MFRKKKIQGDLPYINLCNQKTYEEYLEKDRKHLNGYIKDILRFKVIVNTFFKKVGEYIVESDDGVFIEGLGYFGVCMNPSNPIVMQGPIQYTNIKTGFKTYCIVFIPITKDNGMLNWKMDYSFSNNIKQGVKEKLRSGKQYKFVPEFYINQYSKK